MGSVALQLSHAITTKKSKAPDQGPATKLSSAQMCTDPMPDHPSNYMFYGGAKYLWVPSMALASCHQTHQYFWGGPSDFWKFVASALADKRPVNYVYMINAYC